MYTGKPFCQIDDTCLDKYSFVLQFKFDGKTREIPDCCFETLVERLCQGNNSVDSFEFFHTNIMEFLRTGLPRIIRGVNGDSMIDVLLPNKIKEIIAAGKDPDVLVRLVPILNKAREVFAGKSSE